MKAEVIIPENRASHILSLIDLGLALSTVRFDLKQQILIR
jgi:hypothetical protein